MAKQLIFTSVRRGLDPGSSGYCTVARSRDLRERLVPEIERLSAYHHLNLKVEGQVKNPVIYAYRILTLGDVNYHLFTRIVDAGMDYSRRSNYIAHHLIAESHECVPTLTPADVFLRWSGWCSQWEKAPELLGPESEVDIKSLAPNQPVSLVAETWARVAGDAGCAALPLPGKKPAGSLFVARAGEEAALLSLYRESAALLSARECWDVTFTTFAQNTDRPKDFIWFGTWPDLVAKFPPSLNKINTAAGGLTAPDSELATLAREGPPPPPVAPAVPKPKVPLRLSTNPDQVPTQRPAAAVAPRRTAPPAFFVEDAPPKRSRIKVAALVIGVLILLAGLGYGGFRYGLIFGKKPQNGNKGLPNYGDSHPNGKDTDRKLDDNSPYNKDAVGEDVSTGSEDPGRETSSLHKWADFKVYAITTLPGSGNLTNQDNPLDTWLSILGNTTGWVGFKVNESGRHEDEVSVTVESPPGSRPYFVLDGEKKEAILSFSDTQMSFYQGVSMLVNNDARIIVIDLSPSTGAGNARLLTNTSFSSFIRHHIESKVETLAIRSLGGILLNTKFRIAVDDTVLQSTITSLRDNDLIPRETLSQLQSSLSPGHVYFRFGAEGLVQIQAIDKAQEFLRAIDDKIKELNKELEDAPSTLSKRQHVENVFSAFGETERNLMLEILNMGEEYKKYDQIYNVLRQIKSDRPSSGVYVEDFFSQLKGDFSVLFTRNPAHGQPSFQVSPGNSSNATVIVNLLNDKYNGKPKGLEELAGGILARLITMNETLAKEKQTDNIKADIYLLYISRDNMHKFSRLIQDLKSRLDAFSAIDVQVIIEWDSTDYPIGTIKWHSQ